MTISRRNFLQTSAWAGAAWLVGCSGASTVRGPDGGGLDAAWADAAADAGVGCPDPFAGGQQIGTVDFLDVQGVLFETPTGVGLDGRLLNDLRKIDATGSVTPTDAFYIRTRYPDLIDPLAPWMVQVSGLVDDPRALSMAELTPLVSPQGVHVLECSGNGDRGAFGLLSAADWAGVPVRDVLDQFSIQPAATRVLISGFDNHSTPSAGGFSTPGASWVFSIDELDQAGAFLATEMNGAPLTPDHGFPVRLFIPGWYGCCCIKWVDEIRLVDDSEPATSQMQEFAGRTHQSGTPALARDYIPATLDQAAMPVRIERWQLPSGFAYRVIGIMWGGYETTDALQIRFGAGVWEPVDLCPPQSGNEAWTVWSHLWRPTTPADYDIVLRIDDPAIPMRRLAQAYYRRTVQIVDV